MRKSTPLKTSSQSPADAAKLILAKSAYHSIRHVNCTFCNGVLTLRGSVPNYHMKQIAQTSVQGISGVSQIENRIEVST